MKLLAEFTVDTPIGFCRIRMAVAIVCLFFIRIERIVFVLVITAYVHFIVLM